MSAFFWVQQGREEGMLNQHQQNKGEEKFCRISCKSGPVGAL